MKSCTMAAVVLVTAVTGCKTPNQDAKLQAAGAGGELHFCFALPNGSGDTYEVWATPAGEGRLGDVKDRLTDGRTGPGEMVAIGEAGVVGGATIDEGGRRGIRTYFKNLVDIDYNNYTCHSVPTGGDPKKPGFLCLAKPGVGVAGQALWVTHFSKHTFVDELTVYESDCAATQDPS